MEIDYILAKIKKGKVLFLRLQYFHGMNDVFDEFPAKKKAFRNAVDYQMIHALILVCLGSFKYIPNFRLPDYLWKFFCLSIFAFSFSIYCWVFGGPKWLVHITPIGGIGLVISWMLLLRLIWLNRKIS